MRVAKNPRRDPSEKTRGLSYSLKDAGFLGQDNLA